jgi:hypothetical protein
LQFICGNYLRIKALQKINSIMIWCRKNRDGISMIKSLRVLKHLPSKSNGIVNQIRWFVEYELSER